MHFPPFSYVFPKANAFIHSIETNHLSYKELAILDNALGEAYKLYSYNSLNFYGFTEGIAFALKLDSMHIRQLIQEIYDEEHRKDETEDD